jgi:hypothetical protein
MPRRIDDRIFMRYGSRWLSSHSLMRPTELSISEITTHELGTSLSNARRSIFKARSARLLTVLDTPRGLAELPLYAGRIVALFREAGLPDGENSVVAAQSANHILSRLITDAIDTIRGDGE